jgi:hypothetical protein
MAFNPTTSLWVMWYIFQSKDLLLPQNGVTQVATAPAVDGPWLVANANVSLHLPTFTSSQLFVDPHGGGDAYVLYSGISRTPKMGPHRLYFPIVATIERLAADWTRSTGQAVSPTPHADGNEALVMFERAGKYYVLEGAFCCFCEGGADLAVHVADAPMGPYRNGSRSINPSVRNHTIPGWSVWDEFTVPCQQAGVVQVRGSRDAHGEPLIMWLGDAWQQAPDGRKDHDPQWWVPLNFDRNGAVGTMTRQANWSAGGWTEYQHA